MNALIRLPDDAVHGLKTKYNDLSRLTFEALAVEAYKADVITENEVQPMLYLDYRWKVDEFLRRSNAYIDYTDVDLKQDIDSIRKSGSKG